VALPHVVCCEHDGNCKIEEKGLTVGGHESAWLADLVAACILDNTEQHFQDAAFSGIHRGDGIAVHKGDWEKGKVVQWPEDFQQSVNEAAGNDFLQFTASVWGCSKDDNAPSNSVSVVKELTFPHLDMELSWSAAGDLTFGVHLKPNQALKHLNQGSEHTPGTFNAIPHGAIGRLAKLTTATKENENKPINPLCPKHAEALEKAGLNPEVCPTLKEVLDEQAAMTKATQKEK